MITRFFSTSKPIHLVLIAVVALILFGIARFENIKANIAVISVIKEIGMYLMLFASIAVLSFFVTKNYLTLRNSYKILFYILFIAIIPATLKYDNVLIANFFVLLGLRRIFSLRTNLRIKKKLFDAGLWVTIASLFYFSSILFFALIFASLLLFSIGNIKNWIIPFIGFLTIIVIIISYSIIANNSFGDYLNLIQPFDYDYSKYNSLDFIVGMTILLSFGIWAGFYYVKSFKEKLKVFKSSHHLIIFTVFIAFIIIVISPDKNGSEFIFLFAPLAIIMANFIEGVSDRWFAEVFIWLLILTPMAKLML